MSPRKVFMAFRTALRGAVDGDGELERGTIVGECDSMRLVTKMKRRRHLWMWRGPAELLGASLMAFEHRRRWIRGGGVYVSSTMNGKGEERARRWVL